jgi:hypothetical protein
MDFNTYGFRVHSAINIFGNLGKRKLSYLLTFCKKGQTLFDFI